MKGLNVVTNNMLINCIMDTGGAGNTAHADATIQRNVFYVTGPVPEDGFHQKLKRVHGGLDHNLYWHINPGVAEQLLAQQRESSRTWQRCQ